MVTVPKYCGSPYQRHLHLLRSCLNRNLHNWSTIHVVPHLAGLTSPQCLNLEIKRICDEGAAALGPHLAGLTCMQHLGLHDYAIGDECAAALVVHLASVTLLALQASPC